LAFFQIQGAGPSTRESNQATINTLNSLNPLKRKFLPHQGNCNALIAHDKQVMHDFIHFPGILVIGN
jgi:hypothetical protein